MSSYRKEAAERVASLVDNAPYEFTLPQLRRLLRERGPQNAKNPEFRIWHTEARKQTKRWVKAKQRARTGNQLF